MKIIVKTEMGLDSIERVIKEYFKSLEGQPFWWLNSKTLFVVSTFETAFLKRLANYIDKDWRKHIKLIGKINVGSNFDSKYIDAEQYFDSLINNEK